MKNPVRNLFLIGYRGTGKTVLGKRVARKLNMPFVDTDNIIVSLAEKTIPEIFENDGEEVFRQFETDALKKVSKIDGQVISCGGGIIVKERNLPILHEKGIVCLLTADAKTIYNRIYKDGNRPALTDKDPYEEIEHLLEVRGPLYEKAKDFEVDTATTEFDRCLEEVIVNYQRLSNNS